MAPTASGLDIAAGDRARSTTATLGCGTRLGPDALAVPGDRPVLGTTRDADQQHQSPACSHPPALPDADRCREHRFHGRTISSELRWIAVSGPLPASNSNALIEFEPSGG